MNIGIDFSTFESHDQAYADSWSVLPAGFSPDRSAVEPPPVRMQRPNPAFGLYYDNEDSEYRMRDPLVVAEDGSEVTCSVPSRYEPGKTYYCEVVRDGGSYTAKVTATPSEKPSPPEKLVWRVRLFVVPTSSAEPSYQFHTGAITVSAGRSLPDDLSTALWEDTDGSDGDEDDDKGEVIEIKGWHDGDSVEGRTFVELLGFDRDPDKSSSQQVIVRNGKAGTLEYYDLGVAVPGGGGGSDDFSLDVTDEPVDPSSDHPNGGVKVTLSPSRGQADDFTVWNGNDGAPGDPGAPGAPGKNGKDAVVNVTQAANGATDVHKNGGTKVTLTPNNGGAAATFDVWNGNDGKDGDPGRSVVSASSGDPSQDGDYTVTPVTFVDNAGNRIGPVDVKAKNGSAGISGVQIEFDRDGNKRLEYSVDGGQSWILVAETVALSSVV